MNDEGSISKKLSKRFHWTGKQWLTHMLLHIYTIFRIYILWPYRK